MDNYEQLRKRVTELRKAGYSVARIATTLNSEKFVTAQRRNNFSKAQLMSLLARKGLGSFQEATDLAANEWKLSDIARELGLAIETLRGWANRGWVNSRRTPIQSFRILWADEREIDRLRRMAAIVRPGRVRYPIDLITPKRQK